MLLLSGALTSKIYSFKSRPWEINSIQSIDPLDGIGSNIKVDFKSIQIIRILPRKNHYINENWISDKVRFFYDGLKKQRLSKAFRFFKGRFRWSTLIKVLKHVSSLLKVYSSEYGNQCIGIVGSNNLDLKSLFMLRKFSTNFGFTFLGNVTTYKQNNENEKKYKFQNTFESMENKDFFVLCGTNIRYEGSILNLRLQKNARKGKASFASLGSAYNSTFMIDFLSNCSYVFKKIINGKHSLCKSLSKTKKPTLIYGYKFLERLDSSGFNNFFSILCSVYEKATRKQISLNLLHNEVNSVGVHDLGMKNFSHFNLPKIKFLYKIGMCEIPQKMYSNEELEKKVYCVQKPYADKDVYKSTIIIPTRNFFENQGIYINSEGRPQKTESIMSSFRSKKYKEDWKIIYFFFFLLDKKCSHSWNELSKLFPESCFWDTWNVSYFKLFLNFKKESFEKLYNSFYKLYTEDFYMSSALCKSSKVMGKASHNHRLLLNKYKFLSCNVF